MAELTQQKPIIRITFDEMEAYMLLPEPEQGTGYTDSQIRQEMAARGITTGIDEQRISDMLEGHTYNAELLVAQGKKPVDGTDGYYEYKFDTNFDGKPKLLPDGSVDYWSVHSIESVTAGQVIAVYHPAVSGEDGMSVKGRLVPAKHGREQMPLKGKGFDRMDDEVTYTASMDGKIEMQNDRIVVLPVHEVSGNAEYAYDYIRSHFKGVQVAMPQGTYMLLLDCTEWCRKHGITIDELQKRGASIGVIWQDGSPFHSPCSIRMNLALPFSLVEEAMERLRKYVFV